MAVDSEVSEVGVPSPQAEVGEKSPLEQQWEHVLAKWEDEGAHRVLIELAQTTGNLPAVAGWYRRVAEEPTRRELAQTQLKAITVLALAQLVSAPRTVPDQSRGRQWLWLVVLVFGLGSLAVLLHLLGNP
jgi:hypothetical protein